MNDENMKEPVPVQDADVGTAADVEAVMKKIRQGIQCPYMGRNTVINHPMAVGGFLHLLHLCNTVQHCTSGGSSDHFPRNDSDSGLPELSDQKGVTRVNYMPWYDVVIMVAGSAPFFYFALHAQQIIAGKPALPEIR